MVTPSMQGLNLASAFSKKELNIVVLVVGIVVVAISAYNVFANN
jgi:hypothetical protein